MVRKHRYYHRASMLAWLLCFLAIAGDGTVAVAGSDDQLVFKLMDEYHEISKNLLRVLEGIQNEDTARDALPELTRLQKKLADNRSRARGKRLSDEAREKN